MQLTINDVPVELTLEHERTLGEVLDSLQVWADGQGQSILSTLVDGEAEHPGLRVRDIAQVGRIDLEVVDRRQQSSARLDIVESYFGLVAEALAQGNAPVLRDLHAEYGHVTTALDEALAHQPPFSDDELRLLSGPWTPGSGLEAVVTPLRDRLAEARRELEHPLDVFASALGRLGVALPQLREVSGYWQRGQDGLALGVVQKVMGALGSLQRTASQALDRERLALWTSFRSDSEPFLAEVEEALTSRDVVLLGDLLEYELAPRLEALHHGLARHFDLDPTPGVS